MDPHLKNGGAVSLKSISDKTEKIINFIKVWLLSTCLFNNLCTTLGKMSTQAAYQFDDSQEKALVNCWCCEQTEPIFQGVPFSPEGTTEELHLFRLQYPEAFPQTGREQPIPSSAAWGSAASSKTGAWIASSKFWKLKIFLISGNINKCSISILFKEMFQHLE